MKAEEGVTTLMDEGEFDGVPKEMTVAELIALLQQQPMNAIASVAAYSGQAALVIERPND